MARLTIYLFGPFQALLDDKLVTSFESAKVRALLAYLATESKRCHSREAIAEMFWPEQPDGVARANLRHALANLRHAIGDRAANPPYLLITPETLQFNPACDAFVDLTCFLEWANSMPALTIELCQKTVEVYRGRFLEGFALDYNPEFECWLLLTRERMDYLAQQVFARLVRDAVAMGDFVQAIRWTQRQLPLEPWNEEEFRQLMWLLARNGQRTAALHEYGICTHMLAAELGLVPQPATCALAERIRTGAYDLGLLLGQDGKPVCEERSCRAANGASERRRKNPKR